MSVALQGNLVLRAEARPHGRTVLAEQGFTVPFHVGKAYGDDPSGVLIVQVANPTAGILAGDRLRSRVQVGPGARLCLTTPSASRVFRMNGGGQATAEQRFEVAPGGWLEVAPEPLVPHTRSRFVQETDLELATGCGLWWVDQLSAGRIGHGETWAWAHLELNLRVKLDGKLVLRERQGHDGASLGRLAAAAGFGASAALANGVLVIPPDLAAGPAAGRWRSDFHSLHGPDLWCGATEVQPGVWSVRLIGRDGVGVRRALRVLRGRLAELLPGLRADLRKL